MKSHSKLSLTKVIIPGILIMGLVGLCSFTYFQNGGEWKAPPSSKKLENPVEVNKATLASGKKSYKKECKSCHGKKGKGDGPNALGSEPPVPNLLKAYTQDQTDGELFWKITNGRKPMPSAKKNFSEEQRWELVNYVRELAKK